MEFFSHVDSLKMVAGNFHQIILTRWCLALLSLPDSVAALFHDALCHAGEGWRGPGLISTHPGGVISGNLSIELPTLTLFHHSFCGGGRGPTQVQLGVAAHRLTQVTSIIGTVLDLLAYVFLELSYKGCEGGGSEGRASHPL